MRKGLAALGLAEARRNARRALEPEKEAKRKGEEAASPENVPTRATPVSMRKTPTKRPSEVTGTRSP